MIPKWLIWCLIIVAFLGMVDSGYLTVKHYLGEPVVCSVLAGCEEVISSKYSKVFGIPVSLLGVLFYLSVFLLSAIYLDTKKEKFLLAIVPVATVGFLASLVFVYIQVFVLHALCLYCMVSALSSSIIFILSLFVVRSNIINNNQL